MDRPGGRPASCAPPAHESVSLPIIYSESGLNLSLCILCITYERCKHRQRNWGVGRGGGDFCGHPLCSPRQTHSVQHCNCKWCYVCKDMMVKQAVRVGFVCDAIGFLWLVGSVFVI